MGRQYSTDELFMQRCIELAKLGAGNVAPNPMVGAVLVHDGRIIGEGYHQEYGQPHAEVNCINNVLHEDQHLISHSTLYVSLEPCSHFGKTPPCSDLIIKNKIPKVVIGSRDPFKEVNGKGIEKLQQAGIEVVSNILESECYELNKRFFTFHIHHRPYIILKWAQSADGKIGNTTNKRLLISNDFTNRLVHKWRTEESAILVGTNTALLDNPSLNTRLWEGKDPVRLVVDMKLRLPSTLKVFDRRQKTIVFNAVKQEESDELIFFKLNNDSNIIQQILAACYELNIQSVLVEGGATLLQSIIDGNLWDEVRIITNNELFVDEGLNAPDLPGVQPQKQQQMLTDTISYFRRNVNFS